jgi:hypothetical protein
MTPSYVRKVLDISTAHIKHSTASDMDTLGYDLVLIVETTSYGWMVYISEGEPPATILEKYPDLALCLKLAQHYDCDWLLLNRDGVIIDELPDYDW